MSRQRRQIESLGCVVVNITHERSRPVVLREWVDTLWEQHLLFVLPGLRDGTNRRVTTERVCALWGAQSFQPDERSVLRDLVRELTEASL